MDIANNLKEKAPTALSAVKEAWYYTFYSSPEVAYEISGLISDKAKLAIGGRPGLQQFARKEYRPGLGGYKFDEKKKAKPKSEIKTAEVGRNAVISDRLSVYQDRLPITVN